MTPGGGLPDPFYQDEAVTLYCADNRDVLPYLVTGSVDLIVADPPYGIGQADWDGAMPVEWFREGIRLLKRDGAAYVFGDSLVLASFQVTWEQRGVEWTARIAWSYEDGPRNAAAWTSKHEGCLFWKGVNHALNVPREPSLHADPRWGRDRLLGDVWRVPRVLGNYAERCDHPTQKPEALIAIPIAASSSYGGLVLDPFAGSGTTLVVAKHTGRRAIGIERERTYCNVIASRLQQAVLPLHIGNALPSFQQTALSLLD